MAESQMEEARSELQEQAERVRSRLVREQMTKLPQQIESLLQRQDGVTDEIDRLNELRHTRGEWTPGMRASTRIAAETEQSLSGDAMDLASGLKQLPAFAFTLKEIAMSMTEVATALEQENTSTFTQRLAEQVQNELQFMLDTMKKGSSANSESDGGEGGSSPGGGGERGGDQDFEPSLAQLKMLRSLQMKINEDTTRLHATLAGDAAAQRALDQDLRRVSDRQGRLADLVSEMVQPVAAPAAQESDQPPQEGFDELDQQLDLLLK